MSQAKCLKNERKIKQRNQMTTHFLIKKRRNVSRNTY
jgi:hypothetical protein